MKPSSKGFLLGLIAGVVLTIGGVVLGSIGLGLLLSSGTGSEWIANIMLRAPRFPESGAVLNLGTVDDNWTLHTLPGEEVRLSSFGGRPLFLNVWATWCGPCVMELPSIERLHQSLQGTGVRFALVSEEDPTVVREFLKRRPLSVPVYVADEVPSMFKGEVVPSTSVIASNGVVVFRQEGAAKWDDDSSKNFLRALAAPPAP